MTPEWHDSHGTRTISEIPWNMIKIWRHNKTRRTKWEKIKSSGTVLIHSIERNIYFFDVLCKLYHYQAISRLANIKWKQQLWNTSLRLSAARHWIENTHLDLSSIFPHLSTFPKRTQKLHIISFYIPQQILRSFLSN